MFKLLHPFMLGILELNVYLRILFTSICAVLLLFFLLKEGNPQWVLELRIFFIPLALICNSILFKALEKHRASVLKKRFILFYMSVFNLLLILPVIALIYTHAHLLNFSKIPVVDSLSILGHKNAGLEISTTIFLEFFLFTFLLVLVCVHVQYLKQKYQRKDEFIDRFMI